MSSKVLLTQIVACLFSLLCIVSCEAQETVLVQNGKPKSQIIISVNATPTEEYAAQELQRAIQKISGAQLPISNTVSKSTFNVIIGTPESSVKVKAAHLFNANNPEEVRICKQGKVLFLAGPTPRAALFAVYTFLQDELNCRWYWPGESGEYLPVQSTIKVADLNISQTPDIEQRSLSMKRPHYGEDTIIWMSRNRLNWHHLQGPTITHEHITNLHEKGLQVLIGGHNINLPKELLEKHPEFTALTGGKRQKPSGGSHLCWSNAGVQQAIAKKIEKWWDEYPTVDSIGFLAADQTHFCECNNCKLMAPDVSTRWQKFCKIVINKVNKVYPGKHYQALAYQAYRDVPTEVARLGLIGYCTNNVNYTKPITDSSNSKARSEIQAWQKLGANMGIRGYQFIIFRQNMFVPIVSNISAEIQWAHKAGLKGWKSEVTPFGKPENTLPQDQHWVTNRMALYVAAQTMWDAKNTAQGIMQDWSSHVFGPAAQPMLDYYQIMDDAWTSTPKQISYFLQPAASFVDNFISDELLQKAATDFKEARTALNNIQNPDEKARIETQINLEAAMLNNWRKVYLLQQGRMGRFKAEAALAAITPKVTAQTDDPAWKNAAALPGFEDGEKQPVEEQTKVLLQWDKDALYLRFICKDSQIDQLKISGKKHDSNVFSDDTIELFLDNPSIPAHYFHIAINAANAAYDAKADGAMNFDKSWNPQFTHQTSIGENSWILDVKLPFSSFGFDAKMGVSWKMSFKRSAAKRRPNSGWPDASYHNPAGFGAVTLVQNVTSPKRVLMYDAGSKSDSLRTALAKNGFTISDVSQDPAEFKSTFKGDFDAVTLYRPGSGGFELPRELLQNTVWPFLQDGGLVLISATGKLQLNEWFPKLGATVKWSGWRIDPSRRTSSSKKGDWQSQPHDLSKVISRGLTPGSAYAPTSGDWEVLASQKLKTGEEMPYLLQLKVGKGNLIITSSNFGYRGGSEMFGSKNPQNAAMLLDNLLAETK